MSAILEKKGTFSYPGMKYGGGGENPSTSFFLVSNERGVSGIYKHTVPPFGDTVRFFLEQIKPTTPGLAWRPLLGQIYSKKDGLGVEDLVIKIRTIHFMIQVTTHFRGHTVLYLMTFVA